MRRTDPRGRKGREGRDGHDPYKKGRRAFLPGPPGGTCAWPDGCVRGDVNDMSERGRAQYTPSRRITWQAAKAMVPVSESARRGETRDNDRSDLTSSTQCCRSRRREREENRFVTNFEQSASLLM